MRNYKGFDYEYDEMFGYVVFDEDGIPVSTSFKDEDDIIATIDRWTK